MYRRSILALVLALGCLGSRGWAQTTRPASPTEDKEIRDAVRGFLLGLAKGNATEAQRHACSDEITSTMIDVTIPLIKASARVQDESVKAFGQNTNVFGGANPLAAFNQYAQRVDSGEVQVKGIYAVLLPSSAPQTQPANRNAQPQEQQQQQQPPPARRQQRANYNAGLYLKHESDAWRVDLSEMPNAQQFAQMAPMLHIVTDAMNSIADELRAGDYENPQDVQQAMRQKIVEGMFRAQQGQ